MNCLVSALVALPLFAPIPGDPPSAAPASNISAVDALFGTPSGPLEVRAGEDGSMSMAEFISTYANLTGSHLLASRETRSLLEGCPIGIVGDFDIAPAEVHSFCHATMRSNNFTVRLAKGGDERIIEVASLLTQARATVRAGVLTVSPEELQSLSSLSALLVSTTIDLPNVDVRQLSNSMRSMITDANTQQMLPAGAADTMVLTGFADVVWAQAQQLQRIDRSAQGDAAREASELRFERFVLRHAPAQQTASALKAGLDSPQSQGGPGGAQASIAPRRQPRVIIDSRTNAVIVGATSDELARFRELIALIDVPAEER